jgi:serine/threonine-protein kinase
LAENSDSVLPPSVKLPSLPQALTQFRKKSQDPEADTNELSRIISTDAGLSTELLRTVNTCKSGTRSKVTSVKQALLILGIPTTLLHLTTSGLKQMMRSTSSKLINFQSFWNTNLERSFFAREVAKLLNADTDLAFTAGMLQDFLLPLITNQLLDDYLEFTADRDSFANLAAFEQQKFKWDHAQAAAQVMYAWQFPDELICCVYYHHQGVEILKDEQLGKTSAAAVAISSLIPDALRQEPNGLQRLMDLEKEWDAFRLLPIAERVNHEFQEMASDARNHFTLLRVYQNALKRMKVS